MSEESDVRPMDAETVLDHAHQLFYGDLGMCGCGNPEASYELVRDILVQVADDQHEGTSHARTLVGNLGAHQLIFAALETAGLLDHGTTIDSAWLTDKGRWYAAALRTIEVWDAIADAGYPHGGEGCTDACWQ